MKLGKLLLAAIMVLTMGLGACASGGNSASSDTIGEPNYDSNKGQLHISGWVSPPPAIEATNNIDYMTEENYQMIKDAGFNAIYALYEPFAWNNKVIIPKALDLAEKVGIKYYVRDSAVNGIGDYYKEDLAAVKDFDYYKNHSAFGGHLVQDEPGKNAFESLKSIRANYAGVFGDDADFFVNLFPIYASSSQTQATSYVDYIESYLKTVGGNILSYDAYPLYADGWGETSLEESFLANLEITATLSKKYGADLWCFIQSMGFGTRNRQLRGANDIGFQVYTDLAYGVKGLQYFCYWTPVEKGGESFQDAMITRTGEKTANYDYVKVINEQTQKFANVFLSFDWQGTLTYNGSNNTTENKAFKQLTDKLAEQLGKTFPTSHKRISKLENNEDVILGTFKDKDDNDGFMLVNYTDPGLNKTSKVKITFKNADKAIVYDKGEKKIVTLTNGVYETNLGSGEGQFIIPFNE